MKTKLFTVGQDWETPIPGFFIISPLRKVRSIAEFTDEEAIEFVNILRRLRKGMEEVLGIKDVYLFENEDTGSHNFHLWVFPRLEWMEKFGRKIESVEPIMTYAKEHMMTDEIFGEVRDYVKRMEKYMH